jgi:hypothetical protein
MLLWNSEEIDTYMAQTSWQFSHCADRTDGRRHYEVLPENTEHNLEE